MFILRLLFLKIVFWKIALVGWEAYRQSGEQVGRTPAPQEPWRLGVRDEKAVKKKKKHKTSWPARRAAGAHEEGGKPEPPSLLEGAGQPPSLPEGRCEQPCWAPRKEETIWGWGARHRWQRGRVLVRGLLQPDGGRGRELCQPVLGGSVRVCVCVCVHAHARRWQEEKVKILQVLCNFLAQLFSLFNLPIPTKVLPFLRKKEERKWSRSVVSDSLRPYQAPPSKGFSRQEYWSGWPFPSPGDLPDPGIEPGSPSL